uniref:EamA family transporter n=1 Tax=Clavibacter michiganensis TaxID=28447 RepID=UPI0029305CF3
MPSPSATPSQTSVAVQFALTGIVWGSSFLFMKVALTGLAPGQVAWGRLMLGALTLGVFMLLRRESLPRRPIIWFHLA